MINLDGNEFAQKDIFSSFSKSNEEQMKNLSNQSYEKTKDLFNTFNKYESAKNTSCFANTSPVNNDIFANFENKNLSQSGPFLGNFVGTNDNFNMSTNNQGNYKGLPQGNLSNSQYSKMENDKKNLEECIMKAEQNPFDYFNK